MEFLDILESTSDEQFAAIVSVVVLMLVMPAVMIVRRGGRKRGRTKSMHKIRRRRYSR